MMKKLHHEMLLTVAFSLLGIFSLSAQTVKTDVTVQIHEPGIQIHEPGIEIHEPGFLIHEPGFSIHEPGFQNQGPGHNSADKIRMQLYPNPTADFVNISSEHYVLRAYSIYKSTGEILVTGHFEVPNHSAQIDVTALDKGTYILVVEANQRQVAIKRFVKK